MKEFTPIDTESRLLGIIREIHREGHRLCKNSFDKYLDNAGNIGVFCHLTDEYERLTQIRKELTEPSDNPNQKYFALRTPITIPAEGDIPETVYSHLYIRQPDYTPYGRHSGDIDFFVEESEYADLKKSVQEEAIAGASLYEPTGIGTLVQLSDPAIDALACVSTKAITEALRIKP